MDRIEYRYLLLTILSLFFNHAKNRLFSLLIAVFNAIALWYVIRILAVYHFVQKCTNFRLMLILMVQVGFGMLGELWEAIRFLIKSIWRNFQFVVAWWLLPFLQGVAVNFQFSSFGSFTQLLECSNQGLNLGDLITLNFWSHILLKKDGVNICVGQINKENGPKWRMFFMASKFKNLTTSVVKVTNLNS